MQTADEAFYQPAFTVETVDTNGAGDSFVAGYLTGVLHRWSARDSAVFACAVGSHCVQVVGASSGIVPRDEILSFIERYNQVDGQSPSQAVRTEE